MQIDLTSVLVAKLVQEAELAAPHECCGILFGTDIRITDFLVARNVHPTPETHFEIDPQALIDAHRAARQGGLQVMGYYHSHPNGPACPSVTDRAMATGDGRIWAIIGAGGEFAFWRDGAFGFEELSYRMLDS